MPSAAALRALLPSFGAVTSFTALSAAWGLLALVLLIVFFLAVGAGQHYVSNALSAAMPELALGGGAAGPHAMLRHGGGGDSVGELPQQQDFSPTASSAAAALRRTISQYTATQLLPMSLGSSPLGVAADGRGVGSAAMKRWRAATRVAFFSAGPAAARARSQAGHSTGSEAPAWGSSSGPLLATPPPAAAAAGRPRRSGGGISLLTAAARAATLGYSLANHGGASGSGGTPASLASSAGKGGSSTPGATPPQALLRAATMPLLGAALSPAASASQPAARASGQPRLQRSTCSGALRVVVAVAVAVIFAAAAVTVAAPAYARSLAARLLLLSPTAELYLYVLEDAIYRYRAAAAARLHRAPWAASAVSTTTRLVERAAEAGATATQAVLAYASSLASLSARSAGGALPPQCQPADADCAAAATPADTSAPSSSSTIGSAPLSVVATRALERGMHFVTVSLMPQAQGLWRQVVAVASGTTTCLSWEVLALAVLSGVLLASTLLHRVRLRARRLKRTAAPQPLGTHTAVAAAGPHHRRSGQLEFSPATLRQARDSSRSGSRSVRRSASSSNSSGRRGAADALRTGARSTPVHGRSDTIGADTIGGDADSDGRGGCGAASGGARFRRQDAALSHVADVGSTAAAAAHAARPSARQRQPGGGVASPDSTGSSSRAPSWDGASQASGAPTTLGDRRAGGSLSRGVAGTRTAAPLADHGTPVSSSGSGGSRLGRAPQPRHHHRLTSQSAQYSALLYQEAKQRYAALQKRPPRGRGADDGSSGSSAGGSGERRRAATPLGAGLRRPLSPAPERASDHVAGGRSDGAGPRDGNTRRDGSRPPSRLGAGRGTTPVAEPAAAPTSDRVTPLAVTAAVAAESAAAGGAPAPEHAAAPPRPTYAARPAGTVAAVGAAFAPPAAGVSPLPSSGAGAGTAGSVTSGSVGGASAAAELARVRAAARAARLAARERAHAELLHSVATEAGVSDDDPLLARALARVAPPG